jgi:hypothetical protein
VLKKILSFVLLCAIFSCYQPKKGCIDITASNYDVAADEACCCTYPLMKAEIQAKWIGRNPNNKKDTNDLKLDTLYNKSFKINKIRFYLSNIRFVKKDGTFAGVSNKIALPTFTKDSLKIENNFLLARPDQITYTIGDFKEKGDVTKLQMTIGVPDAVNKIDAAKIPDLTHPLSLKPEVLWNAQTGYTYIYIEVKKGTSNGITTYKIATPININFPFASPKTIQTGFDILFQFTIDYAKWFNNIDFQNDSDEVVKAKIVKNIPASVSLK